MRKEIGKIVIAILVLILIIPSVYGASNDAVLPSIGADKTFSGSWKLVSPTAEWEARWSPATVVMPDGTLVLMGGAVSSYDYKNDTWQSSDNGVTWKLLNKSSGWSARRTHNTVVMPDGTLVLIGGTTSLTYGCVNDVWQSWDVGKTWVRVNASTGWTPREDMAAAVLSDGRIVVSGGSLPGGFTQFNDVWQSVDKGVTWSQVTTNAAWEKRYGHSMVAMQDGSIVLTGGFTFGYGYHNDVWRSTDHGATWTLVNASAPWTARIVHSSVVLPDGSILLMGGNNNYNVYFNDTWRSADGGLTWSSVGGESGWEGRFSFSSVVMPDGSVVLMGGYTGTRGLNDIWQYVPAESGTTEPSGSVLVKKSIHPEILKQGTDARITITVLNKGPTLIHDVEIADSSLPEFPVTEGDMRFSTDSIEPNGTRILSYTVHATKAGSFRLEKTTMMFADAEGNYHYAYSDSEKVQVLAPLIPPQREDDGLNFFRNIIAWISGRNMSS